jgi:hypothetical protein
MRFVAAAAGIVRPAAPAAGLARPTNSDSAEP